VSTLYAGNRVVHYARASNAYVPALFDRELFERVRDPQRCFPPPNNAQFPVRVEGRLRELVRRKLWCLTARDLAQMGPVTDPGCLAPPGEAGHPTLRISTGGRTWRRRISSTWGCPSESFHAAERRFDHYVTRDRFEVSRRHLSCYLPQDLIELRARATDECDLPRLDFTIEVVIDADGSLEEVRSDGNELPAEPAACIARVAARGDYRVVSSEGLRTGFELERTVIQHRWIDGYPYPYEPPFRCGTR
jgi:hypothetical protein